MRRAKKFLTVRNMKKLYTFLKRYIKDVLKDEEVINTFAEAYKEASRVYSCYSYITPSIIAEWLRGLPINLEYSTYNIVCMMLECITGSSDYNGLENYVEDPVDLDNFYWNTLGRIIYIEGN